MNLNDNLPKPTISLNDTISAPISQNEKLGSVTYNINGIEYSQDLIAETAVEKDLFFIKLSVIALSVLIVLILLLTIKSKTKKNKKRKLKYKSDY